MSDTKEVKVSKERPQATEDTSVKTSIKRVRTGPREFIEDSGPLAHVMQWKIPGFHLYVAPENDPRKPMEIQYLTSDKVCYDFVEPWEVDAREIDGTPMKGDRIRVQLGGGLVGILLKLPEEYFQDDLKARQIENNKAMYHQVKTASPNLGIGGTTTTSDLGLK